jgi:hypothetical protein
MHFGSLHQHVANLGDLDPEDPAAPPWIDQGLGGLLFHAFVRLFLERSNIHIPHATPEILQQ